ncbi:hypothetical protein ABZX98_31735 [Streptomyces sp. NPDC002992]|uniref:hypothetical protein n=1 Tax=Streptomyces sp. NPDC002992 TaxID=3154273 RepID=UPI0033B093B4
MTELIVEVTGRPRPGLCLRTAGNRLVLTQGGDPLLFAVVERYNGGVDFYRTAAPRPVLPPLRAAEVRAYAGRPDRWGHRVAEVLTADPDGPLHDGRWVLTDDTERLRIRDGRGPAAYWSELLVEGHPDGYIDWWIHNGSWEVLPLRPLPDTDDGRVKAYRKQAREGILPPVLLWWVSGLDCHLLLDGHARLAAAIAEDVEPASSCCGGPCLTTSAYGARPRRRRRTRPNSTDTPRSGPGRGPPSPTAPRSRAACWSAGSKRSGPATVPPGPGPWPEVCTSGGDSWTT